MAVDAAVVAAVMCSESHVDLRVSEGPGLFDNMETEPGPKNPEPGEVSHLSILSDIGDTDFKEPSLVFRDVSDPPVSIGGIISGPGPPEPELGIHWDCQSFQQTLVRDPGNPFRGLGVCWLGQSFWMTVCQTPGGICRSPELCRICRVLPTTVGRDPGSPSRGMEGCCQDGIRGTPLRTNMRGLPVSTELGYEYLIATMIWMKYICRGWTY